MDFSTYADDHQLHEMGEDLAKDKSSLAGNAEKASRWYEVNLLKGNFSKYKTMLMHNDHKLTTSVSLNIQGNEIEVGLLPYMGYRGVCHFEVYGFQAVYSGIGYINQRIWVWKRVSFSIYTDQLAEDFGPH